MKLYGLTVVKNEMSRYLQSMLDNCKFLDEHFVYDDQSTDGSFGTAISAGCYVSTRPDKVASFLENEGEFRQDAWNTFVQCLAPTIDDWVLVIDADEVLLTVSDSTVRSEIEKAIRAANSQGAGSVLLPVPEVFGFDADGTPLVRVDGEWGRIRGTRLFQYQSRGRYREKAMGCGGEPTYVTDRKISAECHGLRLMHYGYSHTEDQVAKHERYTSLLNHGHSNLHVQSIVQEKTLKRWDGPVPRMERGQAMEAVNG